MSSSGLNPTFGACCSAASQPPPSIPSPSPHQRSSHGHLSCHCAPRLLSEWTSAAHGAPRHALCEARPADEHPTFSRARLTNVRCLLILERPTTAAWWRRTSGGATRTASCSSTARTRRRSSGWPGGLGGLPAAEVEDVIQETWLRAARSLEPVSLSVHASHLADQRAHQLPPRGPPANESRSQARSTGASGAIAIDRPSGGHRTGGGVAAVRHARGLRPV